MDKEQFGQQAWALRVSLLRLAGSIVRNAQDAEDAVSAAYVQAFRHLEKTDEARFRPWLMKITANCCYDILRKRSRAWREPLAEVEQAIFMPDADASLYDLVNTLPTATAQVLILYYYEGFSGKEIGGILGISRATVNARLLRGRKRLKVMLDAEGAEQDE